MNTSLSIEEKIKQLPPDLIQEVEDFVGFLLEKKMDVKSNFLKQNWAGSLKQLKDKYTSIELQKKAMDWR